MLANNRPKVLIVEDDSGVRHMLALALRSAGYEAVEVDTGGKALKRLSKEDFAAVVLDLGLPDKRAGAVLDYLRKITDANDGTLQWAVISALDEFDAQSKFGSFDGRYFSKPFDPWALIAHLKELLKTSHIAPC
jgi:DNA-binding response OmpR family regulator